MLIHSQYNSECWVSPQPPPPSSNQYNYFWVWWKQSPHSFLYMCVCLIKNLFYWVVCNRRKLSMLLNSTTWLPSISMKTTPYLYTYPTWKQLQLNAVKLSCHSSLYHHPPLGVRSLVDIWWRIMCCWDGVGGGGGTTSTCLAGCWCSHRPLASCHLWDRREAADTPRESCSLAHSATESLTHQGGREGGGRGG